MKNTESESKENKLRKLLAPYSKMNGEQLIEAYCDSAELQNEFSFFERFIFDIREHYKDSPLHQEEVWVSLLYIRDTSIRALILQRQITKKQVTTQSISLEQKEFDILCTLGDDFPTAMFLEDIKAAVELDRRTIKSKLERLQTLGLAERLGQRKGWGITKNGLNFLQSKQLS